MSGTSGPQSISTRLQRIAEVSRASPQMVWTTLAHHIDMELLHEAYRLTRKDGATGVDGQTAEEYAGALDENLRSLLDRFKSGTYHAPPVRRVHIPKGDGSMRPLGIPTFEDKILQRAVAMVLGAVYEQDFLDCSYGFRPGRSAHQALDRLWHSTMEMGGCVVVELDIKSFFDSVNHARLREVLDQRIQDGVIRRTIHKWLKAGVLEGGQWYRPDAGTPQGGVISPLLANIYLHEVLDRWFEQEVRPRMRGGADLIRYADDAVLLFRCEADAMRVLSVLPKRFGKYGLTLHPEKTRLVRFVPPGGKSASELPGSFDFLGLRHFWARSRRGRPVVKRKTAPSRLGRALRRVSEWCRRHLHEKVAVQHERVSQMLQGHYAYFGITGNSRSLEHFRYEVTRIWRRWLNRRSQRRSMPWPRFTALLQRYRLPQARVVHSVYARA